MLSRSSVLFVYLVAALGISAVATPMGQSGGYGGVMKQPSGHNPDQEHPYPSKNYSARDSKGQYKHSNDKEYEHHDGDAHMEQCNVKNQHCCNQVTEGHQASSILALLSITNVITSGSLVGTNCSPYMGKTSCEAKPICCEDSHFNGLIVVGCSNVNIG